MVPTDRPTQDEETRKAARRWETMCEIAAENGDPAPPKPDILTRHERTPPHTAPKPPPIYGRRPTESSEGRTSAPFRRPTIAERKGEHHVMEDALGEQTVFTVGDTVKVWCYVHRLGRDAWLLGVVVGIHPTLNTLMVLTYEERPVDSLARRAGFEWAPYTVAAYSGYVKQRPPENWEQEFLKDGLFCSCGVTRTPAADGRCGWCGERSGQLRLPSRV